MGHSSVQSGRPTLKAPGIASTIVPPRHIMATRERGKLGRGERVALAGLASMAGGSSWQGGLVAGASERGMISGQRHAVTRNAIGAERVAPSMINPLGTSYEAMGDMVPCHAVTSWGAETIVYGFQDHDGVWHALREETDGDEELPRVVETVAARERRQRQASKRGQRQASAGASVAAPMREATREDRPTVIEDRTDDLVAELLASMGHRGEITPKLRALALDALESKRQRAEYVSR